MFSLGSFRSWSPPGSSSGGRSTLHPTLRAGLPLLALLLLAEPVAAQLATGVGIRAGFGYSVNHEGSDRSVTGSLHATVPLATEWVRIEVGIMAGAPYGALDGGVELRLPLGSTAMALVRAGGGFLLEDGYQAGYGRAGAGLETALGRRIAVRVSGDLGTHGGQGGPHRFVAGIEYRLSP